MEVRALDLVAFGPFTGRSLRLDHGPGLYVVYGPNEAGKSSALRGLRALLYGIPERTRDNFLHPNERLRITGRLRNAGGRELAFTRRKGRKRTLLDEDQGPLDPNALEPYLHGVSAEVFETVFGIDHAALVRGGEEILAQRGEVGQALFAAALGSPRLHEVLEGLDAEADALFRPRGSTQAINAALKGYERLAREVRDQSLGSGEWERASRAFKEAGTELARVQEALARRRAELNRLKRVQRILPKLARRRELRAALAAIGEAVPLPADFAKRRQETLHAQETARELRGAADQRLAAARAQLAESAPREGVLDQAAAIEALHARLGAHRKAMQDRPRLVTEQGLLRAEAEARLSEVWPGRRPEEAASLPPAQRVRITELGTRGEALRARLEQADTRRDQSLAGLEEARRALAALPEPAPISALRAAVAEARRQGDLDAQIDTLRGQIEGLRATCADGAARLGLDGRPMAELARLAVPEREAVERLEQAMAALDQRRQSVQGRRDERIAETLTVERQIDEIRRAGEVPTEAALREARAAREAAWRLLHRRWLEGEDVTAEARELDPEHGLPEAFERRVAAADGLADRLRREAERVHQQAMLLAAQADLARRGRALEDEYGTVAREREALDRDWRRLWTASRVAPRAPREMRAWLEGYARLVERLGRLTELQAQSGALEAHRSGLIQALHQAMPGLAGAAPGAPESLGPVLRIAEAELAEREDLERRRARQRELIAAQEAELRAARQAREACQAAVTAWQADWGAAMRPLALEATALPAEASEVIEGLHEALARRAEAERLAGRIQGIDADAQALAEEMARIAARVAPELSDRLVEQAVPALQALLAETRVRHSRREQLEAQLAQASAEIAKADTTLGGLDERLAALCREARCPKPEGLAEAERRSADQARLSGEIEALERAMLEAGEGETLAALEGEAEGVEVDSFPARVQALETAIETDLAPRHTRLAEAKGRLAHELELMDGGARAADLAEEAQSLLASIRAQAERYLRLRLAARVLRGEIERYRQANQGPLIARAARLFQTLTLGSFSDLSVDFDEADRPVLLGARPDGERVPVTGMSSGTRDQLYLALRLASLERYLEQTEPMPFVVDDILVHFDDPRARAALEVLAELGRKTQVILFTHHARLAEQARQLGESARVLEL